LRNEDSFLENGIIDSTGVLELISFLEQRFGLVLGEPDLTPDNLDSIDKVTRLVEHRLGANVGAVSCRSNPSWNGVRNSFRKRQRLSVPAED